MRSPEKSRGNIVNKLAPLALPILLSACYGPFNAHFPNCGDNSQTKSTEIIIGTRLLATKSVEIGDLNLTTGNHGGEFNFHPLSKKPLEYNVYPIENGISFKDPETDRSFQITGTAEGMLSGDTRLVIKSTCPEPNKS